MLVEPINDRQRQQVCLATDDCVQRAARFFRNDFDPVSVSFDLRGRAAGMYRVRDGQRCIRYNPYIFAKYFDDSLAGTVPHEVAHYVTDILYGLRRVRPHGAEWRAVMQVLGAAPCVTGDYDLSGVPVRRHRRFAYRCECDTHQLSTRRHNQVHRGKAAYRCRHCGVQLVFVG